MPVDPPLRDHTIQNGDVRIHCVATGPADGPIALLLHGFPARWATWRYVMPVLAAGGYHVIAPDLRGYGESDKPRGVARYAVGELVSDVTAILDAFECGQAFVAGHDFGGGLAWALAMARPDRVARLAILNSVHPVGFERQMKRWSQIKKSWYVLFFLVPGIPEWFLARDDYRFLRHSLAEDGLSPETVLDLLEGVRPPGALEAAIDWYRASFRGGASRPALRKVDVPTLIVWGDKETHLDPELATPPPDWTANVRVEHVPEAGHWVQHDAPDRVAELLLAHAPARG
jgi:pimeloyl-ACP methyl ester carboxylesterase